MKKDTDLKICLVLAVLIFIAILFLGYVRCFAGTDTLEGEELTSSATIEGVSTTDTCEGQELKSGGCTSGTEDIAISGGSIGVAVSANATGQSWIPATDDSYLYSIEVELSGSSGQVTMRWGTSNDLTSYLGEVTVSSIGAQGYYEFVFQDTTNLLDNATTYYWGFILDSGSATFYRGGTYANGTRYYSGGADWNMESPIGQDINSKYNKCD